MRNRIVPTTGLFESFKWTSKKVKNFRLISAVLMVPIFIWNVTFYGDLPSFVYLTSWGVYFNFLYFELMLLHYVIIGSEEKAKSKRAYIFLLYLCEIAFSFEFLIILFYWITMFPWEGRTHSRPVYLLYTLCVHLIAPILIFVENIVNKAKYKKKHYFVVLAWLILYGLLNIYYSLGKKEDIYERIDWKSGISALFIIMALALGSAGFYLGFWLSKRKKQINTQRRLSIQISVDPPEESETNLRNPEPSSPIARF